MTPYEVAQRMVRARRADGTPLDAGLIAAYLEHEAALAGVPVERLLPIAASAGAFVDVMRLTVSSAKALDAAIQRFIRVMRDGLEGPPRQSDYALA